MSKYTQIGAAIVIKNDIKSISVCEKYILLWTFQPQMYDVIVTMTDGARHIAFTGSWEECNAFMDDVPEF
jgi:hypothetical protein